MTWGEFVLVGLYSLWTLFKFWGIIVSIVILIGIVVYEAKER